ncbi:hypothetical protein LY76DRAFT_351531 [Colletotrichum caudatum]|nr:hypothetical protein LY76DRAFT_351531 [Colletotrichum caudatum]
MLGKARPCPSFDSSAACWYRCTVFTCLLRICRSLFESSSRRPLGRYVPQKLSNRGVAFQCSPESGLHMCTCGNQNYCLEMAAYCASCAGFLVSDLGSPTRAKLKDIMDHGCFGPPWLLQAIIMIRGPGRHLGLCVSSDQNTQERPAFNPAH